MGQAVTANRGGHGGRPFGIVRSLARHSETALGFAARHLLVADLTRDAILDLATSGGAAAAGIAGAEGAARFATMSW
ncbi:MAG: hypothetical protein FJW31_08235 [Acidobacteria bacterium]|nr:hypothetical protein [Acidobacteriota bacterium]